MKSSLVTSVSISEHATKLADSVVSEAGEGETTVWPYVPQNFGCHLH